MTQEQINLLKEYGFQIGEDDHRGRTPIYSEKFRIYCRWKCSF